MHTLPVSCLASCYRGTKPDELRQSIFSLFVGPFIPDQIVLVIDGPIDDSLNHEVRQLSSIFPIDLVFLSLNHGLGFALNQGLSHCSHELVIRFDTDDISEYGRISALYDSINSNLQLAVVGTQVLEFRVDHAGDFLFRQKLVPERSSDIVRSMRFRNPLNHPSVIFRKSAVLSVGGYSESIILFEDYNLWLKLAARGFSFANLPFHLVLMRRSSVRERRVGYSYCIKEFSFAFSSFSAGLIGSSGLMVLVLRAVVRFLTFGFVSSLLPWRRQWHSDFQASLYLKSLSELF